MSASTGSARFSVVIPLYQKREFILRALESVREQTLPPSEIIVVDDGSTDGGGALVEHHVPEATLIAQENAGVGAARNRGIMQATSEWVAFLDADDYWLPDHLLELSRVARDAPAAHLIATQHEQAPHGVETRSSRPPPGHVRRIDYLREAAERTGTVHTSCSAIRRSVLDDIGGFGPAPMGQDIEFFARVALHRPVAISDARTAVYVRGVGGTTDRHRASTAPPPRPSAVDDVSPAHATVAAALRTGQCAAPRASLVRFLNGRTASRIGKALTRGEIEHARTLRRFLRPPLKPSWLVLGAITFLPSWAATGIVRLLGRRHR